MVNLIIPRYQAFNSKIQYFGELICPDSQRRTGEVLIVHMRCFDQACQQASNLLFIKGIDI